MNHWSCGRVLYDAGLPVAFGQGKSGTGWMKMAKLQFATSAEHLVAAPGATTGEETEGGHAPARSQELPQPQAVEREAGPDQARDDAARDGAI